MSEKVENFVILEIKDSATSERDGIILAWGKNGLISFLAAGINAAESKNRANLIPGLFSELIYFEARQHQKMNRLKKANLRKMISFSDLTNLRFLQRVSLFLKNFKERFSPIYETYDEIIENFESFSSVQKECCITFMVLQALKPWGIEPNFSSCVVCGTRRNICHFSFGHGGYFCEQHAGVYRTRKNILELLYYARYDFYKYLKYSTFKTNDFIYKMLLTHIDANGIFVNWEEPTWITEKGNYEDRN
ncbi:DNA repair protein RecO [Mycoplasmopsis columbinasalis]|uniref:Recombinational DNA repair protein O n=1 Tax=Mycoplasmopsis columbinasalis TaxID=114880 RepID=A0A449BA41_9BACT|nr:DNA repair protein RecO [Mycoplasmopsis columbinasalis]VEU78063.1 recombinational DNA repair protein O [Mycoplasmopsis columbinasalis]